MTTKIHTTILLLGAFALGGCYSGIDAPRSDGEPVGGGPGAADGGGADGGDGADDDGAGATDPVPSDDDSGGDDAAPFEVPGDSIDMLPFPVRMNNLSAVTGAALTHPIFTELYNLRYQLGDHDYATLHSPDLRWSSQKMQNWVKGLLPVCDSSVMQAKYPGLVDDPAPLFRAAFGRDPVAADTAPLDDIRSSTYDDATKYRLSCLSVLSALEFVAS